MSQDRHGWRELLAELERRRARAAEMGGRERLERLQYSRGKLDARQRMSRLFDDGRYREVGALAGGLEVPADALVAGFGRIGDRPAAAFAEDFSLLGGSIGPASMAKRVRLCEMAARERVPLVVMLEGAGHRLADAEPAGRVPNDLLALADLAGRVPLVCVVLGSSAGHGALAAPLSDFVVMTEQAALFTGGPPLVKAATGEDVTPQELGGARVCSESSGLAHRVEADDAAAIATARAYLGYLPAHRDELPPQRAGPDSGPRRLDAILERIPANDRRPYRIHDVLELLVDAGSLFELGARYGASLVTALARLGGRSVAILANNPAVRAGAVDAPAAIKAEGFLETVGAFGLPAIFLADNPGVMAGRQAERDGILRWGGRMFRAQRRLRGPKLHVTLRKSFGFGATVMGQNPFDRQTLCLALPGATMGAMPADSGGRAAGLDATEQARAESAQAAGPWQLAAGMTYDDVIDPRDLRNALLDALALTDRRA